MSTPILFLDVDGVLNVCAGPNLVTCPAPGMRSPWIVDLNKVQLLNHVLRQTDVKIVVSSTWRLPPLTEDAAHFCKRTLIDPALLHEDWRTIRSHTDVRWTEISEWLSRHDDVKRACVIDDMKDAEVPGVPFVLTNETVGMTYADLTVVMRKLGYNLQGGHVVQKRKEKAT